MTTGMTSELVIEKSGPAAAIEPELDSGLNWTLLEMFASGETRMPSITMVSERSMVTAAEWPAS